MHWSFFRKCIDLSCCLSLRESLTCLKEMHWSEQLAAFKIIAYKELYWSDGNLHRWHLFGDKDGRVLPETRKKITAHLGTLLQIEFTANATPTNLSRLKYSKISRISGFNILRLNWNYCETLHLPFQLYQTVHSLRWQMRFWSPDKCKLCRLPCE